MASRKKLKTLADLLSENLSNSISNFQDRFDDRLQRVANLWSEKDRQQLHLELDGIKTYFGCCLRKLLPEVLALDCEVKPFTQVTAKHLKKIQDYLGKNTALTFGDLLDLYKRDKLPDLIGGRVWRVEWELMELGFLKWGERLLKYSGDIPHRQKFNQFVRAHNIETWGQLREALNKGDIEKADLPQKLKNEIKRRMDTY